MFMCPLRLLTPEPSDTMTSLPSILVEKVERIDMALSMCQEDECMTLEHVYYGPAQMTTARAGHDHTIVPALREHILRHLKPTQDSDFLLAQPIEFTLNTLSSITKKTQKTTR
jgi:hypothetical protein